MLEDANVLVGGDGKVLHDVVVELQELLLEQLLRDELLQQELLELGLLDGDELPSVGLGV